MLKCGKITASKYQSLKVEGQTQDIFLKTKKMYLKIAFSHRFGVFGQNEGYDQNC